MNKQRLVYIAGLSLLVGLGLYIWWSKNAQINSISKTNNLDNMSLAMDWTPNTNHTGIYVAMAKGWYKKQGIDLKILPYSSAVFADVLVSNGKADVGISSTEGVVADTAVGAPVVSIAAIIQHNSSALITRKDLKITKPSGLDNKSYGGFGAAYEEAVVGAVIKNDGGQGKFKNIILEVGALEALKSKRIDFVWGFLGWEGIWAKKEGLDINTFSITEYGIPDYSTPNIITSPETIKQKPDLLRRFILATSDGYEYARKNASESAKILIDSAPEGTFTDPDFVYLSQEYVSSRYADEGKPWGLQEKDSWYKYPQFMIDAKAVLDTSGKPVQKINFDDLYTNQFFN